MAISVRRFYQPKFGNFEGWLVDVLPDTPDEDGMVKVRRVSDDETSWVYPSSLSEVQ